MRPASEKLVLHDRSGLNHGLQLMAIDELGHGRTAVTNEPGDLTWQSLSRGTGNVETDYLNGEFVRIAGEIGREAPINATLAMLVRQAVARGARPGEMTLEQLSSALARWVSSKS